MKHKKHQQPSAGKIIARIAIGILFILAGFSTPDDGWTVSYFLTALVMGGALIAWGVCPVMQARKATQTPPVVPGTEEQHRTLRICACCGAPGTGDVCEYCGQKHQ